MKPLHRIFTPFFLPIKTVVAKVGAGFQEGEIVEVRGYPVRVFCLRDPAHIAQLFNDPAVGSRKYPPMLPRVRRVMGKGAYILTGGDDWKDQRQKVQQGFRRPQLEAYATAAAPLVAAALDAWKPHAVSSKPFDAFIDLRLLIDRIAMHVFFSRTLSDEELSHLQEWTHFIDSNFVRPLPLVLPLPENIRFRRYEKAIRQFMLNLIKERRKATNPPQDLLTHLLTVTDQSGRLWNDNELVGEIFSIYFGTIVMSTTLAWSFYVLGERLEVQRKMAQEADTLIGKRAVAVDDLLKLKYSQSVLKEVLRIFPPSWGYPRYCENGMRIGEVTIPPRSMVIPMVYYSHRLSAIWESPEEFRPERFMDEKLSINPFAYMPFGAGPRACLGAGLAPYITQTILVETCRRYEVTFSPRFAGDPVAEYGFGIHPKDEVQIRLTPRQPI